VLAIAALAAGWLWGWRWLDPAVALLAAVVIARWSWGVIGGSARALLDASAGPALRERVRTAIETDGDARLADLHVWQVGPAAYSVVASLVADHPLDAWAYRRRLLAVAGVAHATVEVHRCRGPAAAG
jgi:Co/Zn/Cd efflux system component